MSTRLCLSLWLIWFLCFHFDALTELGAFMWTKFLCISVLKVASGPRVKLASCKSALNPLVVYSIDRSKAVVPVLVFLFVALLFILRGDLFYILPCVILFLCFSVLIALWLPHLGKRELILVLFIHLFDLRLFGFVYFLFLLVSGKGCGLWLWQSLDFSLNFFLQFIKYHIKHSHLLFMFFYYSAVPGYAVFAMLLFCLVIDDGIISVIILSFC